MNAEENKKAIKLATSLFAGQTVTQEQGVLLREAFAPLGYDAVAEAIKEHRRTHEFLSIPQLLEGCRAAVRGETMKAMVATDREGTWFDVRRRQNASFAGRHDVEVTLRVYRDWWVRGRQSDDNRASLKTMCRNQLMQAAPLVEGGALFTQVEAEEWAESMFGDVPYFRQCLEVVRDTMPTAFMPQGIPAASGRVAS